MRPWIRVRTLSGFATSTAEPEGRLPAVRDARSHVHDLAIAAKPDVVERAYLERLPDCEAQAADGDVEHHGRHVQARDPTVDLAQHADARRPAAFVGREYVTIA